MGRRLHFGRLGRVRGGREARKQTTADGVAAPLGYAADPMAAASDRGDADGDIDPREE